MNGSIRGVALLAAALALPTTATAQGDQADLKAKREKKLAKEVFHQTPWVFDYDAARKQAREEGKLLFTYFTRSYAR